MLARIRSGFQSIRWSGAPDESFDSFRSTWTRSTKSQSDRLGDGLKDGFDDGLKDELLRLAKLGYPVRVKIILLFARIIAR
jgi:hypothetical protein